MEDNFNTYSTYPDNQPPWNPGPWSVWPAVNPANGLPMLPGGVIDVEGNPYGTDDD